MFHYQPLHRSSEQLDDFQLNLFCCKADCAIKLEQAGKLARLDGTTKAQPVTGADWQKNIRQAAFAQEWASAWFDRSKSRNKTVLGQTDHEIALGLFFAAHDTNLPAKDGYFALCQAYETLSALCRHAPSLTRLSSLARIASELGMRTTALTAIAQSLAMRQGDNAEIDEPFLPACPRFDGVNPQSRGTDWMLACLLEQMEKLRAFSSYYSNTSSLIDLHLLQSTGFQSEEMNRRCRLIHERFGI